MSSSEAAYASRAARFYGPERVRWSRAKRIAWLQTQIIELDSLIHAEHAAHKANCPACQRGALCLESLSITPKNMERHNQIGFMRGLIYREEQDEVYARRARERPVDYKQHIDGFCSYWQNVRHRKFELVGWECEECGERGRLDAHHLHYDTLGFESLSDLKALCRDCHENEHDNEEWSDDDEWESDY